MITKDEDEVTVVTKEQNLAKLKVIEKNRNIWKLVALKLVVSTYSKDYLLVKKSQLKRVKAALGSLGFREFI